VIGEPPVAESNGPFSRDKFLLAREQLYPFKA